MKKRLLSAIIALLTIATILLPAPFGLLHETEADGLMYYFDPDVAISKANEILQKYGAANKSNQCAYFVSEVLRAGGLTNVKQGGSGDLINYLKNSSHFGGSIGTVILNPKGEQLDKGDVLCVVCTHNNGNTADYTNGHTYGSGKYYGQHVVIVSEKPKSSDKVKYYGYSGKNSTAPGKMRANLTLNPSTYASSYNWNCGHNGEYKLIAFHFNDAVKKKPVGSDYLSSCIEYPTYGRVEIVSDTYLKTLPCSRDTNENSDDIAKLTSGDALDVIAIYKNDRGNYWYKTIYNGTICYLYSGNTKWKNWLGSDITIANPRDPEVLTQGKAFDIKGTVTSKYNQLCAVHAYVYKGTATSGTAATSSSVKDLKTKKFEIFGTAVNNNLKFGSLAVGNYMYVLKADCTYSYCSDGTTLTTRQTGAPSVFYTAAFQVVKSGTQVESITGTCGENLTWSFNPATGKLVISGYGYMTDYDCDYESPWRSSQMRVLKVTLPNGLTNIGTYAFYHCDDLTSISLPNTVTRIDEGAFHWCEKLKTVTIPNTVKNIDEYAFSECASLTDVYYQGTNAQRQKIVIGIENDKLLNATWHYEGGENPTSPTPTPAPTATQAPAATQAPSATPKPTPAPIPTPEPATVKRVQAKKSVKLQVPKVKGNSYQWYFRTSKNAAWQSMGKKGAGKVKLSVKTTMAMDGWQYRCQVTSASGITYSDIYELYVYEPLKVRKQPKWNKKTLPGEWMQLSITATGASSYQWVMRPNKSAAWTKINGATGSSYVVEVKEGMAGYQFACQISGRAGTAMSKAAIVKMAPLPKPKITQYTVWKKAVWPGERLTLTVKALNADSYQWYYRTSANGAWIIYSGATQPTLTFTVGAGTNGYQYKCTVKGRGGSVDSKPVILKVLAP